MIVSEAPERIVELSAIKAEIRGRPGDERRDHRQTRTRPVVEALRNWLDEQLTRIPARSSIAEAVRYGNSYWQCLCRLLDDGSSRLHERR